MNNKIRIYNMGYKDCKGWFGYIPPRHKKRVKQFMKKKNRNRKKDHYLRINISDLISIKPYRTEIYV